MLRRLAVIGMGLSVLGGCMGWGYGYHRRAYGAGYYGGGYSYSAVAQPQPQGQYVEGQPQPQGGQVVVQGQGQPQGVSVGVQAQVGGEGIQGSDGTRGWRVSVGQPEQEFQRLAQLAARMNCQVEQSTQTELRAMCNGNVHVVVRFDQQNIYKLCAPGTDPGVCAQMWSSIQ